MALAPASRAQWTGLHDPSQLVRDGDRLFTFYTTNGIGVYSADNHEFFDWRGETPIFPDGWPDWINTYVPNFAGLFWAPDCIYRDGRYYVYYSCSTFGNQESAIGLVSSESLLNPVWTDHGVVVFSNSETEHNAIDPDVFFDNDGRLWMTWGSYWDGIFVTELSLDTGKPINISNRFNIANGFPEAASIIYHEGFYYLFFNRGQCCAGVDSTYILLMGRSTSVTGPYIDRDGVSSAAGGGSVFLQSTERFIGPGHLGSRKIYSPIIIMTATIMECRIFALRTYIGAMVGPRRIRW